MLDIFMSVRKGIGLAVTLILTTIAASFGMQFLPPNLGMFLLATLIGITFWVFWNFRRLVTAGKRDWRDFNWAYFARAYVVILPLLGILKVWIIETIPIIPEDPGMAFIAGFFFVLGSDRVMSLFMPVAEA